MLHLNSRVTETQFGTPQKPLPPAILIPISANLPVILEHATLIHSPLSSFTSVPKSHRSQHLASRSPSWLLPIRLHEPRHTNLIPSPYPRHVSPSNLPQTPVRNFSLTQLPRTPLNRRQDDEGAEGELENSPPLPHLHLDFLDKSRTGRERRRGKKKERQFN